jgi:hypothetical protein
MQSSDSITTNRIESSPINLLVVDDLQFSLTSPSSPLSGLMLPIFTTAAPKSSENLLGVLGVVLNELVDVAALVQLLVGMQQRAALHA